MNIDVFYEFKAELSTAVKLKTQWSHKYHKQMDGFDKEAEWQLCF